ncbi:MAG: cytochrome c [Candidatus Rokubacteria bacterium]|nr:cytochrome c [Candidatus Rokubacteria bacterium]
MKWVFLLCLLAVFGAGGLMGLIVVYRWMTSMQADVKVVPGQAELVRMAQPVGTVPRTGGELVVARETYATRKNPVPRTRESVARGEALFAIYCTPCHGARGKGDGLVAPRFIPPPDLTSPVIQGRTDGHIAYYIGYGGAVMPAYSEALSVSERWDLVNYLRTLAQK